MTITRLLISTITDPYLNSLWEKEIFRNIKKGEKNLLLWRNSPSIHIGRHQNPWIECNIPLCHSDLIPIIRRSSGGGAVYHDLGNSLYSFQGEKSHFKRGHFLEELLKILNPHLEEGKKLKINERYDIIMENNDYKVGGSAFRIVKDKSYHHGTLLLSTKIDKMSQYLKGTFPFAGFELREGGQHTESIRSKTANINITHEKLCHFIKDFYSIQVEYYDIDRIIKMIDLQELEEMKGWDFLFGKCPPFTLSIKGKIIKILQGCIVTN